jgi:hydroxyacyl-ACP dehydratase HTD2-like protein with hotdog domain
VPAAILTQDSHEYVGRRVTAQPHVATATEIARFALAIGATDLRHLDAASARAAGYPDVVAPLSYYMVIRHGAQFPHSLADLRPDGTWDALDVPSRATRRMAGDDSVEFMRQICAGDRITLATTLVAVAEKDGRSGPFATLSFELDYRDASNEPVALEHYVRILK